MRRFNAILLAAALLLATAGLSHAAVYDYQFFGNANGLIANGAGDITYYDFDAGADFRIHLLADTANIDATDPLTTLLPVSKAWIDLEGWGRSYFKDSLSLFLSVVQPDPDLPDTFTYLGFTNAEGDALVADFTSFVPYGLAGKTGPHLLPLLFPIGALEIGPDMFLALESISGDGQTESVNFQVPEPGTVTLLGAALAGLAVLRRRRDA